jgi:hypothetical protein
MDTLIAQTREAIQSKLYYMGLMTSLAIPDIAGALESVDGKATRPKYSSWYERWVRPRLRENRNRDNPFTGDACWQFRCSMLHQGSSIHPKSPYARVIFIEPGSPNYSIHYCLIGNEALLIQIDEFVEEMLTGCEKWLLSVKGTQPFDGNFGRFATRHPNGLAPYVRGVPVVG